MNTVNAPQNGDGMIEVMLAVSQQIEQENGDEAARADGQDLAIQQSIGAAVDGQGNRHGAAAIDPHYAETTQNPNNGVAGPARACRSDQYSTRAQSLPESERHERDDEHSP